MYERYPKFADDLRAAIQASDRGCLTLIELVRATGHKGDVISAVATQMQQEGTLARRFEGAMPNRKVVFFIPAGDFEKESQP